jgi:DNA-binding LytR/AlgR family response regulator
VADFDLDIMRAGQDLTWITAAVLEIDFGPTSKDGFAFAEETWIRDPDFGIVFLTGRPDMLVGRTRGQREAHLVKPVQIARIAAAVRKVTA